MKDITTKELFSQVITKRSWYKPLGWIPQRGRSYKMRFQKGELSEGKMYEILVELGYKYRWIDK